MSNISTQIKQILIFTMISIVFLGHGMNVHGHVVTHIETFHHSDIPAPQHDHGNEIDSNFDGHLDTNSHHVVDVEHDATAKLFSMFSGVTVFALIASILLLFKPHFQQSRFPYNRHLLPGSIADPHFSLPLLRAPPVSR